MLAHLHRVAPGWQPLREMRSSNGGKHGLAGWGFRGFPEAGAGLWADDGTDFISYAGSPLTAADLRLAKLRSVSEFSGAEGLSLLLGAKARRPALRCHRRAFEADQARRTARRRWRVPAALGGLFGVVKARLRPCLPQLSWSPGAGPLVARPAPCSA